MAGRLAAFHQGLALLGWTIGRNVRTDTRWATANAAEIRRHAAELAVLAPDVILAGGTSPMGPMQQATRTVPIVFVHVIDPVGAGLVESLARPGGNATGFTNMEYSMSGKWLELLKEIAPGVARVAVLRDATQGFATSLFAVIQAVAPALRVEVSPVDMRDAGEIERAVADYARSEWRSGRDGERVRNSSSRSDRRAGGPPQAARGLLRSCFRRCRRSDLLWG
jgi:putative tryptophan/tyrosine transport system substrate-binding protein